MALREILARFGFQVDQGGLKKAQSGITGVVSSMRTFGAAIAGSVVVRGIANFVNEITVAGDALGKTSVQLGLSSKELQAWQTAAGFAGVEMASMNQGFRVLSKNAVLAQQGSKQAGEAFKGLGVDIEQADGSLKTSSQLAREAGIALGGLEDRTLAVGIAQQVFGKAGAALLPLFQDGAEGLDKALAKLEEFGGGLSDQLIPLAEESRDRFFEWEIATTSLKSQFAVAFLPILNQVVAGISKVIAWVSKATAGTSTFKSAIVSLGIALTAAGIKKFGGSLMRLAKAAALPLLKFILLYLVVDDLIALFEGRGSVIGDFIDDIFGKGSSKKLVQAFKDVGAALKEFANTGDWAKLDHDLEKVFGPPGQKIVESLIPSFTKASRAIKDFKHDVDASWEVGLSRRIVEIKDFTRDMNAFWEVGLNSIIVTIKDGIHDVQASLVTGFQSAGTQALAVVKGWINSQVAQLKLAATLFKPLMGDLGTSMIEGVIEGIEEGADALLKTLSNVVVAAVGGSKKAIEAKSPSKLAGDEIGTPIVQGVVVRIQKLAKGASQKTATALQVASGLAKPSMITAPMRGGGGGGVGSSAVVNNTMHVTINGSPSDPQIAKARQGLRSELRDSKRATLDALTQRAEVPA